MARPKGLRLSRPALEDMLEVRRVSMTDVAAKAGIALTTLSGLAQGDHRAGWGTIDKIASALDCHAETLFPEMVFSDLRESAA